MATPTIAYLSSGYASNWDTLKINLTSKLVFSISDFKATISEKQILVLHPDVFVHQTIPFSLIMILLFIKSEIREWKLEDKESIWNKKMFEQIHTFHDFRVSLSHNYDSLIKARFHIFLNPEFAVL